MSGSFPALPQIQPFQAPNLMALSNAVQEQSMNAMRERQLFGAEQEKNALRRYLADPTVDLTSPDAARKLLEIAPTTGAATYQALLRGYADKRAAEASVRAGTASSAAAAASSRQAELTNLNIQKANFDLAQRGLVGIGNLPDEEKPAAWAAWRAETERAVPWTRGRISRDYSPAAYRDALLTAQGVADRITAEARPRDGFTLSPGQTRFDAAGQPIATADPRDTARDARIRSIMETQNVPLQIAAGIVDGVLVPIQDPVSGQTRLFNLANNTFVEFTPAGAPAPAAPAPMATGPRVGVAPPAPAPMATGPRVGVAPPPNAMVAEPANAMLALPGAAAQPNMVQLPTFAAPTTRPEADYQKRVLDLMADLEKQRIENLRARTARREDAAAVAAEEADKARGVAQAQAEVRGRLPPPPAGQRYNAEGRLEDIPGSERERAAAERVVAERAKSSDVVRDIDRILDLLDTSVSPVTGLGAPTLAALASGSPAANVRRLRDTIESIISLSTLQELRAQSPSGAALGQVTNQDMDTLKASLGSLSQDQSPSQFRQNLLNIRNKYMELIFGPRYKELAPPAREPPAPARLPGRRGAPPTGNRPTLEQFLERARQEPRNANVSDEDLTSYYNRTYGGR